MRWPGFVGPTYTLRSTFAAMDRAVNCYPELNELRNQKNAEIGSFVDRPPMLRRVTLGDGPIRGMWQTSTGRLLVVSGNSVYRVGSDWVGTLQGTIASTTGPVSIADNGTQALIVDGSAGYIVDFAAVTVTQVTAEGFPTAADCCTFQDGYFIVNNSGTGQFGISSLYNGTAWDGLDYATAEGEPDNLLVPLSINRQLWLLGTRTFEVWWNTGASDFPFSRIDGAFGAIGCGAAFTAKEFANAIVWLSDHGAVYMSNGFQPTRISNHAVEIAIQNSGDFSDASAWVYVDNGHWFYCLNLPGAVSTWVYDLSTGQWHERTSTNSNGIEAKWRAGKYAFAYNSHVVGDDQDGRLYTLEMSNSAVYSDDGATITRRRISPHLSADLKRIFVSQAQIDLQAGVGLDGTQQGTDPQVMLQMSRDGGINWDQERWASAGKIGATKSRAIWRRNGMGFDWVCQTKVTDPVRMVVLGMEVQVTTGAS